METEWKKTARGDWKKETPYETAKIVGIRNGKAGWLLTISDGFREMFSIRGNDIVALMEYAADWMEA